MQTITAYFTKLIKDLSALDTDLIILAILIVCAFVVLDGVRIFAIKKQSETGIPTPIPPVSVDGSTMLPVREYLSEMQGLAGRPDALISENGFIIPVERKPLSHKLRDRYVAQLLVYMRLVEEFEGKKPPYGYLILGPKCKKFKIINSEEKQAWLQKMIEEMREVVRGSPAKPDPHPRKCARCDVRGSCEFKVST